MDKFTLRALENQWVQTVIITATISLLLFANPQLLLPLRKTKLFLATASILFFSPLKTFENPLEIWAAGGVITQMLFHGVFKLLYVVAGLRSAILGQLLEVSVIEHWLQGGWQSALRKWTSLSVQIDPAYFWAVETESQLILKRLEPFGSRLLRRNSRVLFFDYIQLRNSL